jgi:hypothetical protein
MHAAPFNPSYGNTVTLATAAGAVNGNLPPASPQVLFVNMGTGVVFVRIKPNGVATDASAADCPIPPNGSRVLTKDSNPSPTNGQTVVSVFSPGGAVGNVYACPGAGFGNT